MRAALRSSILVFIFTASACVDAEPEVRAKDASVRADAGGAIDDAGAGNEDASEVNEDALAPEEDSGVADSGAAHEDAAADEDATASMDATTFPDASTPPPPPDGGMPPNCIFNTALPANPTLDPRLRMPTSRLTELESCIQQMPAQASALVDAFLEEHRLSYNAAPLVGPLSNTALILYRGDASNLTVSGSFDGWPSPGTRTFRNIANTDLHVASIPVLQGERHQYKLTRNLGSRIEWTNDPKNRWVVWDGFDVGGPGQFNNEVFGINHIFSTSVVYRFFVRDRDVFLQLPLAHFDGATTMGVLYVHDGNEMLTRAGMQPVVDQTISAGRAAPTAIAYIALPDQNIRYDEYTYGAPTANGDNYIAMIADEIAPEIEAYLRLGAMPELRGLAGASLGGLISFYGAWTRNDKFRLIGGQSSSLFWNNEDMIDRFENQPLIQARIYLDSGSPQDNSGVTQAMADVLETRGYDYLHIEEMGGQHEWPFWAGRFDELLEFLY